TLLVLVSLSVYTFDVSKTMFEDKDIVSMSFRARNTCRRDIYWLQGLPDRRTHGVTTRPRIPTLRLMNGGISYESFRYRSNRIHRLCHRPRAACGGASGRPPFSHRRSCCVTRPCPPGSSPPCARSS